MSREAVVRLFNRVREDPELRARLAATPTADSYRAAGGQLGYEFSGDDLQSVMNAERFYAKVLNDAALSNRLAASPDEQSVVAFARELGFECQLADLQAVLLGGRAALTEAQLEEVAGGRRRNFSFPDVCKTPTPGGPVPIPYPNV